MSRVTTSFAREILEARRTFSEAQAKRCHNWITYSRAGAGSISLQRYTPTNVAASGKNLVLTTRAETATCISSALSQGD